MATIANSTLRKHIKPGTVIKIFGRTGVVYSDEPGGMIRLHCLNHEVFAFRPEKLNNPVKYEVLEEHPPTVFNGEEWNFESNVVS